MQVTRHHITCIGVGVHVTRFSPAFEPAFNLSPSCFNSYVCTREELYYPLSRELVSAMRNPQTDATIISLVGLLSLCVLPLLL